MESGGKSQRNHVENPSASTQISASVCTGKSRSSSENVCYPCQVPYIATWQETITQAWGYFNHQSLYKLYKTVTVIRKYSWLRSLWFWAISWIDLESVLLCLMKQSPKIPHSLFTCYLARLVPIRFDHSWAQHIRTVAVHISNWWRLSLQNILQLAVCTTYVHCTATYKHWVSMCWSNDRTHQSTPDETQRVHLPPLSTTTTNKGVVTYTHCVLVNRHTASLPTSPPKHTLHCGQAKVGQDWGWA